MTTRITYGWLLVLGTVLLLLPQLTQAQISADLFQNELSLQLDPAFPRPGETVSISLDDYGSTGTYGSAITWRYDGSTIIDAENQRQVEVEAGPLGSSATVEAILTTPTGGQQVARTTIEPMYIDIVFEPQTYVPYFYIGRAVPSLGSTINATALINNGSNIDAANHLYTWRLNQTTLEGGPLRGGVSVSFEMPMGDDAILTLEVTDLRGAVVAQYGVRVPSITPQLRFYEISSLYGMNNRALTNEQIPLVGANTTLQAVPYYLDTRTYNNPDVLEWSVDGRPTSNGNINPYTITLQGVNPGNNANIGFHVRSLKQVLQGVRDSITVSY